ncbi:MAG: hypothetical protein JWM86_536 [Thermoleophilia bacterium]|nr:hypothetical protein [Thermoleophilia bacterium]
MSTARSVFTEAIEDHLALKKQNAPIEASMPIARYDVGDPLDRYPGGPNRSAEGTVMIAEEALAANATAEAFDAPSDATQVLVGPSPEQAMEAATALEPSFADRPFEPLNGLAPMLSLVEDIDIEDEEPVSPVATSDAGVSADVLRFPGGVGPREDFSADEASDVAGEAFVAEGVETHGFTTPSQQFSMPVADEAVVHEAETGEQPVLVIDADEPLATSDWSEPVAPSRSASRRKPRFFGLGRKKGADKDGADGWFTDGPRDFNWD